MKKFVLNFWLLLIPAISFSLPVDLNQVIAIVAGQIVKSGKSGEFAIKSIIPAQRGSETLFYSVELSPVGYLIVAADDNLPPVIAYSFENNLDSEGKLVEILVADISLRLAAVEKLPAELLLMRKNLWRELAGGISIRDIRLQQWPPAGTTSTGGWLETNWTQNSPYNLMVPIDPVTSTRSYVGCPATAMAQVLNFHQTTNNTQFTDGDDYYHNYAGRTFWIDDDYDLHGFPPFPELNTYLDTLSAHYANNITLTNQDKAAISFACGTAARQVYSSAGSGTFSVNQAYDAYIRFGCNTAELLQAGDTSLYSRLAQNMKDSLPAHLALVDSAWSTGHNIVVDGYNTNNYFHVNFGWGGSSNGWYLIPEEIPYSLTVIEGLIVDILKDSPVAVPEPEEASTFTIYPNPAKEFVTIETIENESVLTISDMDGKTVFTSTNSRGKLQVDVSTFTQGVYVVKMQGSDFVTGRLIVVR
ncbi:MAG: thiol protease/hemagglutinin PrtT [Bacteroidetes bacterium]|nr:thiol protease/hemagglutinin PrtT [Bacteroidota bacterium]MBU1718674.1 thiol protease/hemagglutinin PrtT [Bacteroidota bacterium]